MDQCKNCAARGDLERCVATECSIHQSWFAQHIIALYCVLVGDVVSMVRENQLKE